MKVRSRFMAAVVFTALVLVGSGGCATTGAGGGSLEAARVAIDEGRYGDAIPLLRERLAAAGGTADESYASYLLGLALFSQTDAELTRLRGQKLQKKDFLEEHQANQLRESLALLTRSVELAPQAPYAPDAAYLAARVQDWGYLKRYDAARAAYQGVVERYPGTEGARKAAERIKWWNDLFKHGELKPGQMPPKMH